MASKVIYTLTLSKKEINWGAVGVERVLQNVQNLLSLTAYEIAFDRTRGLPADLVDMPAGEASCQFIARATEQLQRFEPRAKILNSALVGVTADGQLNFEVVIDVAV